MPDPLSMGNSAIQDMLFSGDPIEIPLWNGKQNMSLVIGSDQKNEDLPENDQNQNQAMRKRSNLRLKYRK